MDTCRELSPRWALQHPQTGISPPELLEMQSLELSLPTPRALAAPSSPLPPAARCHVGHARTQHNAARLSQAMVGITAMSLKRS